MTRTWTDRPVGWVEGDPLPGGATPLSAARLNAMEADIATALSAGSGAGLPSTVLTKTANYTAAAGEFVQANVSGGGFAVTLPSAPAVGALVSVKKTDNSANTLTIAPAGGGSIDGDANATTTVQNAGAVFEHVGSDVWRIVASMTSGGPAGPTGPTGPTGATGATGATGPAGSADLAGFFRLKSGFYFTTPGAAPGILAFNPSAGYLAAVPVIVPQACTIDRIGAYVTTAAASSTLRFGIYTDDGTMRPGTLVLDAGTIDSSSTGFKEITISQALSSGIYWLAAVQQGTGTGQIAALTHSVPIPAPSANFINGTKTYGVANNGGTSGALPGTFGTPAFYQSSSTGSPFILLRVA